MKVLKFAVFTFFVFFTMGFSSCSGSSPGNEKADGAGLYKKHCRLCHGVDGTLGLSGAADLSRSALSPEDTRRVIESGRRTMQAFDGVLNEEEIKAVTDYVISLRR